MTPDLILLFIPTIAAVSFTPGLCMTLAFTLGLSIGYRRTLWMMWGKWQVLPRYLVPRSGVWVGSCRGTLCIFKCSR